MMGRVTHTPKPFSYCLAHSDIVPTPMLMPLQLSIRQPHFSIRILDSNLGTGPKVANKAYRTDRTLICIS